MRSIGRLGRTLRERWLEVILLIGLLIIVMWYARLGASFLPKPEPTPMPTPTLAPTPVAILFDGVGAYQDVVAQTNIGPRPTGSEGSTRTGEYIQKVLEDNGWQIVIEEFEYKGTKAHNIIGKAGSGPVAILGAHYDTRRMADQDPDPAKRNEPVMGANDGASGVAVLLGLARSLNKSRLSNEVWLTFFDAEDNGELDGWDWSAGSRYLADHLLTKPAYVIVVDMVGDADQQIYKERNSTPAVMDSLWALADRLGYGKYILPDYKWSMVDDHTPFLQKQIPAVDIIDFDYPYWHTTQDTADKVSPASLERVGRVLQTYLEE